MLSRADLVLVTGATGFVGAAVARNLTARGVRLRLLVRRGSDRRNLAGLPAELVEGDLLVLCSDGLHGMIDDRAIAEGAADDDLDRAAEHLVSLAKAAGGHDNVTVVLVRVEGEPVEVEVCCPACGKPVIEGNAFCIECGKPL